MTSTTKPSAGAMKAAEKEQLYAEMLTYRKKHFAVEVKPERSPLEAGHVVLSVTKNGTQWASIGLLPDEVDKVIAALNPSSGLREMAQALATVTALARIKYGNLDKDVDAELTKAEDICARYRGKDAK